MTLLRILKRLRGLFGNLPECVLLPAVGTSLGILTLRHTLLATGITPLPWGLISPTRGHRETEISRREYAEDAIVCSNVAREARAPIASLVEEQMGSMWIQDMWHLALVRHVDLLIEDPTW